MEADALTLTIEQEVLRWPGATATPGRFGATAFRYGEREIGHLQRCDRIAEFPITPDDAWKAEYPVEPVETGQAVR